MLKFWPLFLVFVSVGAQNLENIRNTYVTASLSKENALNFYQQMEKVTSDDFVILAYVGASKMIYAKYAKKRIELLKEGKPLIEKSIENQPNNIEIRLIRLSVQENLPKVVPYRKNIDEDKKFIIENIDKQSVTMQKYVRNYIKISKVFSEEEKKKFVK